MLLIFRPRLGESEEQLGQPVDFKAEEEDEDEEEPPPKRFKTRCGREIGDPEHLSLAVDCWIKSASTYCLAQYGFHKTERLGTDDTAHA